MKKGYYRLSNLANQCRIKYVLSEKQAEIIATPNSTYYYIAILSSLDQMSQTAKVFLNKHKSKLLLFSPRAVIWGLLSFIWTCKTSIMLRRLDKGQCFGLETSSPVHCKQSCECGQVHWLCLPKVTDTIVYIVKDKSSAYKRVIKNNWGKRHLFAAGGWVLTLGHFYKMKFHLCRG